MHQRPFARGLLEVLRFENNRVAAYDADGAVGQLFQYEGQRDQQGLLLTKQDPLVGCSHFDIREEDERDILLNVLAEGPEVILSRTLPFWRCRGLCGGQKFSLWVG